MALRILIDQIESLRNKTNNRIWHINAGMIHASKHINTGKSIV